MESGAVVIIQLGLRIVGVFVCVNKAKELNRNHTGWGIFGIISPIIAMIWIQFMKSVEVDDNVELNKPMENNDGSN